MRDPVLAASSAALAPAMPARWIVSRRFFLQLLDLAKRPEIARVTISTNGLRIASDFEKTVRPAASGTRIPLPVVPSST